MSYWERAPDPRLSEWIERCSFSIDPPGVISPPIRVLPDGRIDLLVSVGKGVARADVFGVKTAPFFARSDTPVENVALTFRPGAARALLGVDAGEIRDRVVCAADLLGADRVAQVLDAPDLEARCARLESALLARSREPLQIDLLVRRAASRIEGAAGQIRIAALAASLGTGERRLERAFRARVGVGAKTFARICRFRAAWRALESGARPAAVALERGYFDQPHLARDFAAFAGAPPRRIFPSRAGGSGSILGA